MVPVSTGMYGWMKVLRFSYTVKKNLALVRSQPRGQGSHTAHRRVYSPSGLVVHLQGSHTPARQHHMQQLTTPHSLTFLSFQANACHKNLSGRLDDPRINSCPPDNIRVHHFKSETTVQQLHTTCPWSFPVLVSLTECRLVF
jgi:hypothetical protein